MTDRALPTVAPNIRWATIADAPAIAGLSDELRKTSGDPPGVLTAGAIVRDGFGARREFDVFVACDGLDDSGVVVGYALFHECYEPAKAEKGLYLADLCVAPWARRRGIGGALLDAVTREAGVRGRTFVWWLSAAANTQAAAFYAALQPDIVAPTVARVRLVHPEASPGPTSP